jgi:branched-chain amino acid transport system substrate-binding protein
MNKTTKTILGVVIVIILAFLVWYGASQKPQAPVSKEPIKIGVIQPLTGPGSEYGLATQKGLDLAIEEINGQGGILGKPVKLIYEDSRCDPKTGITAFQKLLSIDKVEKILIGEMCSSVTLALAPIAQEQNLLLISSGSSAPKISDYSNVFRTWPSDALQGEFLAKFASDNLKFNKVAILYINNDYGVGLKNAFKKEFESKRGKVVAEEAVPEGATDVKTQLIKVKNLNPQGVFLATYAKETAQILKQAKELGFSTQFFGGEGAKDPLVIEIAKEGAEGFICTIPGTSSTEKRKHFLEAYKAKYNEEPGITADSAYDIPFVIKVAAEKCGNLDVDCLKRELINIKDFEGASGLISFNENGDLVGRNYDLFQVKNGQFMPYE